MTKRPQSASWKGEFICDVVERLYEGYVVSQESHFIFSTFKLYSVEIQDKVDSHSPILNKLETV